MSNIKKYYRVKDDTQKKIAIDYLKARELAKDEMVTLGGWGSLTSEDKGYIVDFFLEDPAFDSATNNANKVGYLMGTGLSLQEAQGYLASAYAAHHKKEKGACYKRANSVRVSEIVATYLSISDAADFVKTIDIPLTLYTTQGIKGVNDGSAGAGLFDFLESTAGTIYETAGLAEQGYTINVGTVNDLITALMDVLRNGNYTK